VAARRPPAGGQRAGQRAGNSAGPGPASGQSGGPLTLSALKQELDKGRVRRIYLLVGQELLLRQVAVAAIETAVLGPRGAPGEPLPAAYSLNRQRFAGEEARASDILAACQGIPMFGERRLVLVEGVEQLRKADRDVLLPGLTTVPETAVLVLSAPQLDGRLTFTRDLRARSAEVPVDGLEERELRPWIRDEFQERGHKITPEAAEELRFLAGSELALLRGEIEKISLYAKPGEPIGVDHVRQVVAAGRGEALDELVSAITNRRTDRALAALHQTLEAGEEPIRILALLQYRLTDLWRCTDRVGGWYREEVRRGAAHWSPAAAAAAVADRLILELLVERITGPGSGSRGSAPEGPGGPGTRSGPARPANRWTPADSG